MRRIYIKILPIAGMIILCQVLSQIPIDNDHPSQILIKRYSALGDIPFKYFGKNDFSTIKTNDYLNQYKNDIIKIHKWDIQPSLKDTAGITLSLKNKMNYLTKGLTTTNFNKPKEHLYQSVSEVASFWLNWREKIISDPFNERNNSKKPDFQSLDEFSLKGILNNTIFISTKFSMYRHSGKFIWISNDYNNEWVKYFPAIDMSFWYTNESSFYIKHSVIDIEIANNPFSWGWSSGRSPIIAADAIPFNRISLYKNIGSLQLEYFHGSLLSASIRNIHSSNVKKEKYIAGHRAQIKLNNNIQASVSELVIYGNRSPEIGYLNPISFFWAKEHNLGDLDNILIALDLGYRVKPGIIFYSTFIIDELSWQDLMSDWWGNKYSYQVGLFLTSSNMSLPDLRLEYNVTRPWTYTHPDFSYTHRENFLGSPYGPNSKAIHIESFYFPKPKITIESSFEYVLKGIGNGSHILNNYDNRDKDYDWNTKFFLDGKQKISKLNISFNYIFSDLLRLRSTFSISETFNPNLYSESQKYREEKFILGLEFKW